MTRQIAGLLRRFPLIMRLPYLFYSRVQCRYTVGVAAVVFNRDGQVLLVEHVYHPRYPWGLPGGWIDDDEHPGAAIARELDEELQLKADVIQVIHIAKPIPNHIDLAFLCEPRSRIGKLSHELLDHRWVDPEQLPEVNPFHKQSIELACKRLQRKGLWERA